MPRIVFGEVAKFDVQSLYFHEVRKTHVDVSLPNGFVMTIDANQYPWRKEGDDLILEIKNEFSNIYKMFQVYKDLIRGIPFTVQLSEAQQEDNYIGEDIESQLMMEYDIEEECIDNNQMAEMDWPCNQQAYSFEEDSQTLEWLFPEGKCQLVIIPNHVE